MFFTGDFRNIVLGTVTVSWFGVGEEFALMTMEAASLNWLMIPVARGWAKCSEATFGKRPAYMEQGVLADTAGMLRIRLVGTRVAEIAKKVNYPAHRAGHLKKLKEGDCIPLTPTPHSSPSTGRGILREQLIKYATMAGVGIPPEEDRSITGGKFALWHLRHKLTQNKGK